MQRKPGFTLIEVLVVVAIIALLVGITMPSFAAARVVSKRTRCQANLSQIGAGVHEYLLVHHDTLPWVAALPSIEEARAAAEGRDPWPSLPTALKNEVGGESELFLCPADENIKELSLGARRYFDTETVSYNWFEPLNGVRVGFKGASDVDLKLRATPLLFDFEAFHGGENKRQSVNILFLDLHVASDNSVPTMSPRG